MRRPMPKVLTQVYMLDRKNWKVFLDHAETGKKGQNVISSSVHHPISLIFTMDPYFFYHTFTNVDFVDKAYAEICDHRFVYISVLLD